MATTFRVRLTLTVLLVAGSAMLLTGLLNYYKFETALGQISESRITYILRNLHDVLTARLTLGLPVSDVPGLRGSLTEIAEHDPQIVAIEIFDPEGLVLISTDTSFEGDLVAESWLRAATVLTTHHSDEAGAIWTARSSRLNTVGMPLRNGLGQIVGSIALTFQLSEQADLLARYRDTLLGETALLTAATCLLAGLVVFGSLRPLVGHLDAMRDRLARLLHDEPSQRSHDAPKIAETCAGAGTGFAAVEARVTEALETLEQTARTIRRLDWEE